ncbi:S8 family serine peptidase [Nesterenkonia sp. K-15-9-6]|uniref:S8 family serine peptidase n=1 Tax=Nesterenkonia sp. K-15-9-6 TaxID=3093918 RepID=UPI0040443859
MHTPEHTLTTTTRPGRFVVVFDSADPQVREDSAPGLLSTEGFSTETYFSRLGVAVVDADSDHLNALRSRCQAERRPVHVLPERIYRVLDAAPAARPAELPDSFTDTEELTWGLQAVRALESGYTGAGVRVAVLDTGVDLEHPELAGRGIVAESFIDEETAQDGHGHGTHCLGTVGGPRSREDGPGYGVAPEAELFAGKVLGDDGSGSDTSILSGIDWALQQECAVISMSLGADVPEVHPPYVAAGRRALEQGSLIIAAAGNNARRSSGERGFVGAPANSPYVMAVGALDSQLGIADFSARTLPGRGGQVDVAGPGVDVLSAWTGDQRHRVISGTSMATPHVSGVAALLAEATGFRARELWAEIVQEAARLELPSVDVGSGLSLAPPAEEQQ